MTQTGEIAAQWWDLPPAKESKGLTTSAVSALARFDQKAKDDARLCLAAPHRPQARWGGPRPEKPQLLAATDYPTT
ncbi:hypothetical protein [Streptomyces sp. NPDC059649]|uniref:hypothetical protein n=1 Tax=Streptomyces sp. NPDC059649 TaxID=3346895 RepID=UPI00369E42D1